MGKLAMPSTISGKTICEIISIARDELDRVTVLPRQDAEAVVLARCHTPINLPL